MRSERLLTWRLVLITVSHVALVAASYATAVLLRFEFVWPEREQQILLWAFPVLLVCRLGFFARYHLFRGWWQYVGLSDVVDIAKAVTAGSLAFLFVVVTTQAFPGFPRSLFVLEWLLTLHFMTGARILSRLGHRLVERLRVRKRQNVLLVGSGATAESALRELVETSSERRPVGFLADGPPRGRLRGLPRLGTIDALDTVLTNHHISEVVIALPPEPRELMRGVIRVCRAADVRFRILSSVQERLDPTEGAGLVDLEELFGPETIATLEGTTRHLFYQKNVLVTGASGQIGRALAWEIAGAAPRHLLLLDRNESSLYYLELEFLKRADLVPLTPVIGDVLDEDRMREVFETHRPDVVIHAAAYTHAALVTGNREEIIENNLRGAETIMRLAAECGSSRFFLLSGDERDPTELACIHLAAEGLLREPIEGSTLMRAAIRFPSVLGSSGCLVTRTAEALQSRRPLEIESSDARVRVVSLSAAVALLFEAFSLAEDGDVLVVEAGRIDVLRDVMRYLGQVWNLPEVPLRRPAIDRDHPHEIEPGLATRHPRVLSRKRDRISPPCVERLRRRLGGEGLKGESLLANSSGR